jgi:hypothetical protein
VESTGLGLHLRVRNDSPLSNLLYRSRSNTVRKIDWLASAGLVLVCLLVLGTSLAGCASVKEQYAVYKLKATPFYEQAREAYMNLPAPTKQTLDEALWEPEN